MASDHVNIDLNELAGHLNGMANGSAPKQMDFTRAMTETSVLLSSKAKESFDQGRTPDGLPWLPLKKRRSGKRNKGKKGLGAKPLRDTDLLMSSMQGGSGKFGSTDVVKEIGKTHVIQGTVVEYAKFHQYGTRHIVPRPFLGISDKMVEVIARYVQEDAARQARQAVK